MRQSSVKASTNTRTRKALVFLWTGTDDDCQPIVYDRTSMCMCCQSDWCHRYCRGRVHDCPISANRHYTSDTVRFLSAPSPSSFILRLANNISFHFFFYIFRSLCSSFISATHARWPSSIRLWPPTGPAGRRTGKINEKRTTGGCCYIQNPLALDDSLFKSNWFSPQLCQTVSY